MQRRLDAGKLTLDPHELVAQAARTYNTDDFGDPSFREPLDVLTTGLRNDSTLTPFGRLLAHTSTLDWLRQRLLIRRELNRHPEIRDEPVSRPLIVVGPPRSGTTLLNYLLAQDPAARPLRTWEALWPVQPIPGPDLRRWVGRFAVWMLNRWIMPDWNRIHPFTPEGPEECAFLLAHTFVNPALMPVRSYREWLRRQPDRVFAQAYTEYREALQVLQRQHPAPGHWVLKSPVHLWSLDALMCAVPEASIVHTHRHMSQVLPSYCSLQAVLLNTYTDQLDPLRMGPVMMDIAAEAVLRAERARGGADSGRILDLAYHELVADPVAAVRRIYDQLGYDFTPEYETRLRAFLARDRKAARPRHRYALEQFGLDGHAVEQTFADYHGRHGLNP